MSFLSKRSLMCRISFIISLWFLVPLNGMGQSKDSSEAASFFETYNRRGISPILLNGGKGLDPPFSLEKAFEKASMELEELGRFDNNSLGDPAADCEIRISDIYGKKGADRSLTETIMDTTVSRGKGGTDAGERGMDLETCLGKEKVAMRILDTIFNADEEGRYNMERVQEKVRYGLNDREIKRLEATSKGVAESMKDIKWAARYLEKQYMVLYDIKSLNEWTKEVEKKYVDDSPDVDTVIEKFNGYKGHALIKVYRLDLNEDVMQEFFEKCWAGPESSDSALKKSKKAREDFHVPLVTKRKWAISATANYKHTDENTKKTAFQGVVKELLKKGTENLKQVSSEFDLSKSLYEYKNVGLGYAKIGEKEGLSPDDRFLVYQRTESEDGVETKRVGELRATTKVVDNREVAKGDMPRSRFVQTWGKKLGKGMLIKEKREAGLGLTLGWTQHTQNFYQGGLEYRLSSWFNTIPGWYLFTDFGISFPGFSESEITVQKGDDSTQVESKTHGSGAQIFSVDIGTSKEFYLLRNFMLAPFGSMRIETPEFREFSMEEEAETMVAFEGGLRLGVNLNQYWRLTTHFAYSTASYDDHARFGKRISDSFAEKLPKREAGADNPFHLKKSEYRYGAAFRLRF